MFYSSWFLTMNRQARDDLEKSFLFWIEQVSSKYCLSKDEIFQLSNISIEMFGNEKFKHYLLIK